MATTNFDKCFVEPERWSIAASIEAQLPDYSIVHIREIVELTIQIVLGGTILPIS